jgi:putative peptidoglycan lipid II flippase
MSARDVVAVGEPLALDAGVAPARSGHEAAATIGVAGWTLVSRVTGFARVAIIGATLGPTFFANIFQATNVVPNITYNLMAGSLLTTLIVPSLVEALDRENLDRARQVTQGLLGVAIAGFCAAGVVVLALGPLLVHLLTLGIHDASLASRARQESWVLLLLVVPQIVLYGIAAVGVAAQNARRHFALAAAAPAVENLGLIATLLLAARWFGTGIGIRGVTPGYLFVLGLGATLSVAAHAALQLFGAARVGLLSWPAWGWHDPAVRDVCRRSVATIGTAMVDAGWAFALIVAAGTVPGGVVALQIGLSFYFLPVALSAKAVGTVLLPQLARQAGRGNLGRFRRVYDRGLSRIWFIAVPASAALVVLAHPISEAFAFGEFRHGRAVELVAVSVASLGVALIAGATSDFARQACYARRDQMTPLIGGLALLAITLGGVVVAITALHGFAILLALGLVTAVGELARSLIVDHAARKGTPDHGSWRRHTLLRNLGVAVVTIGPAALVARVVSGAVAGHIGALAGLALGSGIGLCAYVGAQAALDAPELPAVLRRRARHAPTTTGGGSRAT